jgi:sporulation protein YlmC with PRC-barrel domain
MGANAVFTGAGPGDRDPLAQGARSNPQERNMNRSKPVLGVVVSAVLGLAASGLAVGQASAPAKAAPAPVAGRTVLGVTVAETELIATGYRASKLLRVDVYNDKGEKIGKVEDLVVSPDGTVSTAVINVGGFLGLGKYLVAIPVRQFTQIAPKAVLPNATKDQLKSLPKFEYT